MALDPISQASGQGIHGTSPQGDSGGGGTAPNMPPILDFSGGTTVQLKDGSNKPIPGQYNVVETIPIGFVTSITALSPATGYNITSYAWSNGTAYSSYTGADPGTQITGGQSLGKSVNLSAMAYNFIVDATPRTYSISLTVNYDNKAQGTSTVTFTSDKPAGSITCTQVGTQTFYNGPDGVGVQLNPAIKFQATTTTGKYTYGSFMFLQIINNYYDEIQSANGNFVYQKNNMDFTTDKKTYPDGQNVNGPLQDNGSTLGYPFDWAGGTGEGFGWSLGANHSVPDPTANPPLGTPEMQDAPREIMSDTTNNSLYLSENFSTYLMYKPPGLLGGVWIALSKATWTWNERVTVTNGFGDGTTTVQAQPAISTPSGDTAFPVWVNVGRVVENTAAFPYRTGNPGP